MLPRRKWEAEGRPVRAGEAPIIIGAPTTPRGFPFIGVPVFDVSQTEGPPVLDPLARCEGSVASLPAMTDAARWLGVDLVEREVLPPGVLGRAWGEEVEVLACLSGPDRVRVLAHEYAHHVLHLSRAQRGPRLEVLGSEALREAEADATAFLVCGALGVTWHCAASLLQHGLSAGALRPHFQRVVTAARVILDAVAGRPPRSRVKPLDRKAGPTSRRARCFPLRSQPRPVSPEHAAFRARIEAKLRAARRSLKK